MKFRELSIRNRVLIAIAFVFVASTAITAYFSYQRQLAQLQESLKDLAQTESKLFDSIITADAEGLSRAHIGLDRMDGLLSLFAAGKRDELASVAKPIFGDMKQKNNITHLYFINPDGTVLLRAHKPEQFGDKLARATYKKAAESHSLASGIEMGKNFFSLRSVAPVSYRGKSIGYLEVGQEIDHVVDQMKSTTGNDVSLFLRADFLKAKDAEVKGGKVGEYSILDSTNEELALKVAALCLPEMQKGAEQPRVTTVDLRGARYIVGIAPVHDAAGATCGVLFSQKNVTPLFANMWRGTAASTGLFAGIFLAAVVFLYLSLKESLQLFTDLKKHVVGVTTTWDLTGGITVHRRDEVGELAHAFNSLVGSLKSTVARIHDSSGRLAATAQQITSSTMGLSSSSREQDAAASKASATMMQMSASIETVAGNADSLACNAGQVAQVIQQLSTSSEHVAANAQSMAASVADTSANIEEMTLSIDNVARNAEELVSSVTETSATIEQMTVSIDQVAVNAQQLQQVVADSAATIGKMADSIKEVAGKVEQVDAVAKGAAKEGAAGVEAGQQAVAAMSRVAEVIDKTSASIVNLGKRSEEIDNIVKLINEIANQTNLLALNAAIEAARAGDAGRGFAVVADEVRKLAERSMGATKEIAQVIGQVQEDTRESVRYGEIASREAQNSMELANLVGGALDNIVSSIERTSTLMTDIARMTLDHAGASSEVIRAVEKMHEASEVVANAAREQASGGRQIRIAVERMNHITREVTGATNRQSQGSQLIRSAVRDMNEMTGQVTLATREQSESARQIVSAVGAIDAMTRSVASATAEQKKAGETVGFDMQNIGVITRDNLTSVQQLSGAAQNLSQQAEEMAALVALFKVV